MPTLPIVSQQGPLPITVPFNAPSDGAAALLVSGSVWTQQPNAMISIEVWLDGQPLGSAPIFANPSGMHLAVVPVIIPVTLTFGAHKLMLSPGTPATVSDKNDYFTVALLY